MKKVAIKRNESEVMHIMFSFLCICISLSIFTHLAQNPMKIYVILIVPKIQAVEGFVKQYRKQWKIFHLLNLKINIYEL